MESFFCPDSKFKGVREEASESFSHLNNDCSKYDDSIKTTATTNVDVVVPPELFNREKGQQQQKNQTIRITSLTQRQKSAEIESDLLQQQIFCEEKSNPAPSHDLLLRPSNHMDNLLLPMHIISSSPVQSECPFVGNISSKSIVSVKKK